MDIRNEILKDERFRKRGAKTKFCVAMHIPLSNLSAYLNRGVKRPSVINAISTFLAYDKETQNKILSGISLEDINESFSKLKLEDHLVATKTKTGWSIKPEVEKKLDNIPEVVAYSINIDNGYLDVSATDDVELKKNFEKEIKNGMMTIKKPKEMKQLSKVLHGTNSGTIGCYIATNSKVFAVTCFHCCCNSYSYTDTVENFAEKKKYALPLKLEINEEEIRPN